MRVDYLARFDRAFKAQESAVQREIQESIDRFLDHLVAGRRPQGLGLRRLKGLVWEIRVGLKCRVLFELRKDWLTFIFVGTHDEVRRFLKSF